MKNTKKNILQAVVLTALLCSTVFADGDMGSGGKTCPQGQTCVTGDMGSGGLTSGTLDSDTSNASDSYLDSLLGSVYWYFDWTR